MSAPISGIVSVIARASVKRGCEDAATHALAMLANDVRTDEPDALTYLVHAPLSDGQSLPQTDIRQAIIFASFRDIEAFMQHKNGPLFTRFLAEHSLLFKFAGDQPFADFECLSPCAGFNRLALDQTGGDSPFVQNRHPGVMFEVIANHQPTLMQFYKQVFAWNYQIGTGNFAYVHFDGNTPPLLGGIGQADPSIPGFEPGHSFYLLVDKLEDTISRAEQAGGKVHMPPTEVDLYRFAMIQDPESNTIGLIEPFQR